MKINCDAAFKDSKAALAIVARDSTGSLIYVDGMPYSSMSPLHAEVLAVHYACQLAFRRGWFQTIVESDCQTAITLLSTETIPPWNLTALVGPFKVLGQVESVAYKLKLPQELSRVYNTFHVSNLKKCYSDDPLVVPLKGLQVDNKLHFVEEPVEIMDREVK
ncbi:putative reverse transcriptase domain-containing protein [Tanacetum coccineum]